MCGRSRGQYNLIFHVYSGIPACVNGLLAVVSTVHTFSLRSALSVCLIDLLGECSTMMIMTQPLFFVYCETSQEKLSAGTAMLC
jgi:hypothetical protein